MRHTEAVVKTVRPKDYGEVAVVGRLFREDVPVVMVLSALTDAEAKPLVDFAAGLVIGRCGTMERVDRKVFLLVPSGWVVEAATAGRPPGAARPSA